MIPKFRVFDKKYKKIMKVNEINFEKRSVWIESDSGDHENRHTLTRGFDEIILMQSTGLFDKHGVEIFEGDVLSNQKVKRAVIWRKEDSQIQLSVDDPNDENRIKFTQEMIDTFSLTVCGNIYENPELLEVAK